MSRLSAPLLKLALLAALLTTLTPLAAAPAVAPRPVGLIIDTRALPNAVPFTRFVDVMVETLAGSRQWEPTVLTENSPLVRVSGAPWPEGRVAWADCEDTLRALLIATRLSDVLVVTSVPAAANTVEVFWLRDGEAGLKRLQLIAAGGGDASYAGLTRQLMARLEQGHAAVAETPAVPAPVTPATPPPAAPTAPATVVAVAGAPATTGGGPRDLTPATAPKTPPAAPLPTAVELAQPTTTDTQPAPAPLKVETPPTPAAQPGPAPVRTETPAPATVPATSQPAAGPVIPVTPAPAQATPPPAPPQEPSPFLVAADKYLRDGDYKRVEDMLLKAEDAHDAKAAVLYAWARLEEARQNRVAERTWLERTIAEDPANLAAHLRLAELLRGAGLWRKAAEEYNLVVKAQPDNVFAYLGLSAVWASQSQPRRAAEILTEALKHRPTDASLYLRLGDLQAQRNALAEAEDAYDRAARLSQGEGRADALDRLGDLYVRAGREREGFICYAEASKLRSESNSPLAEKRYGQIMAAADESLGKVIDSATKGLEGYLAGRNVTREEAFSAMSDFNEQVQEVSQFVESITPPSNLKLPHAERKLAYSLAAEAALYGLLYLDQGRQNELGLYQVRLAESRKNLQSLRRPLR